MMIRFNWLKKTEMVKDRVRMTDKLREGQGSTSKSLHGHMKDWEMKGKTQEI